MTELKPALSYDEQIERLSSVHNLVISDEEKAKDIIKRVNYYRLSGYGIGLKQKDDPEKYIDGISLESISRLYNFDSRFKNLLIHTIEQIEIQLRAQISNYLALTYEPEGYMNPANFISKQTKDGSEIHSNIISSFQTECSRQKNVPFVKHHQEKYEGHFPIWVAVELFTFGNLCSLYDIMIPADKKEIANLYNTEANHLSSWILALVEIQNICAHYSRLYNMPLKQTPYLYSEYKQYRSGRLNKVFPVIITIKRMLLPNPELWQSFYDELVDLMDEYQDVVRLSFIGFPRNWKNVLA